MLKESQMQLPVEIKDSGTKTQVTHFFEAEKSGDPEKMRYASTPIEDGIISGSCGPAELALLFTSLPTTKQ